MRRTVLEAAARLFAERGFGGTNLQDIASELAISRPALYYYFKSKEDILASLVEEVTLTSVHQTTQLAATLDTDPADALWQMVFCHAQWLLHHPLQFRVVDRTENDLPVAARKAHDRAKRTVLDNFTRTIGRGIDLGHFRPVDPRVAAFAMIGMCNWTAWWYQPSGRMSSSSLAELIADLAVNAVKRGDVTRTKELELSDAVKLLRDDLLHLERLAKRRGKRD